MNYFKVAWFYLEQLPTDRVNIKQKKVYNILKAVVDLISYHIIIEHFYQKNMKYKIRAFIIMIWV